MGEKIFLNKTSFFILSYQEQEPAKTPDRKENLKKRLSGNTEFIATKYLERTKSVEDSPKPLDSVSKKNSLTRSGNLKEPMQSDQDERSKVTDRWSFKEADAGSSVSIKRGQISNGSINHSRESSSDKTSSVHSRGSSYDVSIVITRYCLQQCQSVRILLVNQDS